jgi:hypothetical protein
LLPLSQMKLLLYMYYDMAVMTNRLFQTLSTLLLQNLSYYFYFYTYYG